MSEPLLRLRGVGKRYGDHVVLAGVDLTVARGETVALLGPSGGGKSTILRAINGLTSFDEGTIEVAGHVLTPVPDATRALVAAAPARRHVGMIFQDFQLFPHLSAIANVTEAQVHVARTPAKEAEARARELLAQVGLERHMTKMPAQLSGGQKQRVAIARALALGPSALLCDEITSALDPEVKEEVLDVLERLQAEGIALLLVTHEIAFARKAAHRVAFLVDGAVVEEGPPSKVLDTPEHGRVRRFLAHA